MLQRFGQPVALSHFLHALLADFNSRGLGGQVSLTLVRGAGVAADQLNDLLVQPAPPGQFDGGDDCPLLIQLRGQREGARGHAANIGMMTSVGHKPGQLLLAVTLGVDRGDHGDVRQVAATPVRVIEHHYVPGVQRIREYFKGGFDGRGHGAQMHWNICCLGDHVALGIEHGAGEIPAFLDVGGVGGSLQGHAHLFGHRLELAFQNLQANRVYGHLLPLGIGRKFGRGRPS